jgi:serine/alanine adding enzyme
MITLCADDNRWDAYVNGHPHANRYHLSAWRRIITSSFGHQTYYLMSADQAGAVNGVLPLACVRSRIFGDCLVSLPFVNYGGTCADSSDLDAALSRAAVELAREHRVRHLELRSETANGGSLQVLSKKVSMRLALPPTAEELWKALGAKLRNQIKRAEREKVEVRIGRDDQLDAFYTVFAENMRDLGTPVYPKRFFASVLAELPTSTWIVTVYRQGQPIASGFLVGFRDAVEVPWASSLRRFNSIGANMQLYWNLLKFSCEQGFTTFDFGRSTPGSGPYQFKRQWSASPVPLNWQYWVPGGANIPDVSPQNPKYQLAIKMWQRLPVPLTRLIGPAIVRNIP